MSITGALMIIAWVLCASVGIMMARYYKPMWVDTKACGQKVWFQVHRALMLAAMFISLIAFILILIEKDGLYVLPEELPKKAHPIIGLIAIICSFLNVSHTDPLHLILPLLSIPIWIIAAVFSLCSPPSAHILVPNTDLSSTGCTGSLVLCHMSLPVSINT